MKRRRLSTVLIMAALLPVTGCVIVVNDEQADAEWIGSYETHSETRSAANADLRDRVGQRLSAEPVLARQDISVSARDGTITLRGQVAEPGMIEQAIEAASAVDGVRRVVARLTVEVRPG